MPPGRRSIGRSLVAIALLALVLIGFGLVDPRIFAPRSLESILLWAPILLVAAMGQFLVVVSGGIDVSIGSILGCAGIGVGLVLKDNPHLPVPVAFVLGAAFGLALGMTNGAIIAVGKVAPLIVTIGTLAAFRGIAFLLSKGEQIDSSMIPDSLTSLAGAGIPIGSVTINWLLIFALAIVGFCAFGVRKTVAGRNLFAFGSNPAAANLKGISTRGITFWVYAISGTMAGLAAVIYALRFGFVNPGSAGQNLELNVIAAVAIGGTKLTGGSGSVLGVVVGCLLLSVINVGLSVLGIDANWQLLAYGAVILIAVVVDGASQRRRLE